MSGRHVFVDTWAWVALTLRDDANHARAVALSSQLRGTGALLVTSNFVIDESATRIRYDGSQGSACAGGSTEPHAYGVLEIVTVGPSIEEPALDLMRRYSDQRFSFTECTSFVIMRSFGMEEAFTGDRHFTAAGMAIVGL